MGIESISNIPVGLIVTIVFGAITLIALGVGIVFGFKRNVAMTIVRLVFLAIAIAVAALCATVVAVSILDTNSDRMLDAFAAMTGDEQFIEALREYMASGSEAVRDVQKLLIALAAPIIFAGVFAISNLLLLIIYSIVTACTCSNGHRRRVAERRSRRGEDYKEKRCNPIARIIVLVLNVAISFTITLCLVLPLTYYVGLVSDVAASAEQLISEQEKVAEQEKSTAEEELGSDTDTEEIKAVLGLVADINASPVMGVYSDVSNLIAAPITTVHGQSIHDMVLSLIPVAYDVMNEAEKLDLESLDTENLSEETVDSIAEFIDYASAKLKTVTIIDNIAGEVLCDAAGCWAKEQPFLTVDIYELVGETGESEIDYHAVIKVFCEVFADNQKPLASDKLELVSGIIGPAGGIMPAITALSNVNGAEDIKNIDKQALEKIYGVANEYKADSYADEKFGRIIFVLLDSSTLGLPAEYGQVLDAVTESFGENERTASGVLELLGDTLIVTVDVVNQVDTSAEDVNALAGSIGKASEILEGKPRVDKLLANVLIDSYSVLPLPEGYGDAVGTFMDGIKEKPQLYTTGSSVLKLLGRSLDVVGDFTDADVSNLDSNIFYDIENTLSESGNEEVNRITAKLLDAGISAWLAGGTYCGIADPLHTYSEIRETLYGAVLDQSLVTASDKVGFIGDMFKTVNDLSDIDFNNVTSSTFYDLAKDISENELADHTSGQLISDAAEAWKSGTQFCGIADPVGESKFASGIYTALINKPGEKVLASNKFIAAGNAVDLANIVLGSDILQSGGSEGSEQVATVDQVKNLVDNLNEQSAAIVKDTLSDSVISVVVEGSGSAVKNDEQSTAAVSAAVGELVDGLLNLKTDESKTAEEVEKEQQAVADLFDAINSADTMDEQKATELAASVKDSEIIANAVSQLVVEDAEGNKTGAIEASVDEETKTNIENALNEAGVDEELKQNIFLIFGIGAG